MPRRAAARNVNGVAPEFHVSILDVDTTGLLDVVAASRNEPVSKGVACRPRDVLVSCLTPKIWRVAVVPELPGHWSCSPEFAVLRPVETADAWQVCLSLHHPSVIEAVQALAKGTSSSRQRVRRQLLLDVDVPSITSGERLAEYVRWRTDYYRLRLAELKAFEKLHDGGLQFDW